MTPSILQRSIAEFSPTNARLMVIGLSAFLVGALLLAAFFPWLSSSALFIAWPFFCVFMLASGLLIVALLYSRYERTAAGNPLSTSRRANQIALWVFAPFFTIWLAGILLLMLAGTIMGIAHFYTALTNAG